MELTAVEYFNKWFDEELKLTKAGIPTACCLSTIGTDDYPNARFVSFKGIIENNFIITGPVTSRKGMEINRTNKVALTFWWTGTERQVRVQGNATFINDQLADKYFSERSRESQIVSIVSKQGQKLDNIGELNKKYEDIESGFPGQSIPRPDTWGGFSIEPVRIEFLEFKQNRFHERKLFESVNGKWKITELQP